MSRIHPFKHPFKWRGRPGTIAIVALAIVHVLVIPARLITENASWRAFLDGLLLHATGVLVFVFAFDLCHRRSVAPGSDDSSHTQCSTEPEREPPAPPQP